ncbi:coiled-coil domain-containing protein 87-like isoform X2 [Patiria miniata]|uniref:Coiled-coil domain-containing protein 87 n=1 Tax=Patiria miniata TaxID=46514 RepID=A0A914B585_PATMI|nr:coiled-coil domain-containing protein 87-like isoform X1 [Patiria miniata]XP_038071407.1 coiled-coil domain-containing protein 87-like isoform X2 [Patiria miniata]
MATVEGDSKSWSNAQALQKKEELYTMGKLGFGTRDLQKRYEDILGPLTLFAPYFHEKAAEKVELDIERPVTPIDESIKTPPTTFSQLAKLIRRRIAAKPEVTHITMEDQHTLAGIIMGEVNCIWPDLRRQVDDPFLTANENKELQRRITVHIVTVCEQLFLHYVEKAKILDERGVFSKRANMSRLNAQLSLDANKFLNILAVRRHIVADIRGVLSDSEEEYPDDAPPEEEVAPLSYQKLIETSRPKRKKRYRQTVDREVRDLNRQMPAIQSHKVLDYLPDVDILQRGLLEQNSAQRRASIHAARMQGEKEAHRRRSIMDQERKPVFHRKMRRAKSLEVFPVETIFEDLGIEYNTVHKRRPSLEFDPKLPEKPKTTEEDVSKSKDSREYFQQDLKKLSRYRSARDEGKDEQLAEDEDLPPLLQAISLTDRADARREELRKQLKKIEEERAIQERNERIEISEPTHPQPATVTTRMPNKSVVRTSDVRVSERVSLSSITLKLNTTVFNELNDDVNGNTIKKLDSNLFRGQEINEVYREIMKTLSTDHLAYDQDKFMEQSSSYHALANHTILASSMLQKRGQDRVLNPVLTKTETPPWGDDREEWSKSPIFNATFAKKPTAQQGYTLATSTLLESLTPNINLGGGTPGQDLAGTSSGGLDLDATAMGKPVSQGLMDDRNARSYASWLAWWKNTISCDDYTKYLSTQETDFLGAVFHMYESDDDEGDANKSDKDVLSSSKMAKQRDRDERLKELKNQKTDFQSGMWNVNSVLMGGLGKDPEVEEEEEEPEESEGTDSRARSRRAHSRYLLRTTSRGSAKSTTSSVSKSATLKVPGSRGGDGGKRSVSRLSSRATMRDLTSRLSSTKSLQTSAVPEPLTSQDRLEAIWTSLQMPDNLKLDMAIKYSSDDHMDKLESAIDAWELATEVILQREAILTRLETFERLASDPDRFFQKGHRGSSVARLKEARQRSELYTRLHDLDVHVRDKVQLVHKKFADVPTFQGRPYLNKMKVDCTEMLYWLQQERRQYALDHSTLAQGVKLPVADLSSLSSVTASSTA